MPTISVIIPFYNAEKFLARAVQSILQQTYQNYELLLINDGSTDQSLAIAQKLAEAHQKIRLIDQTNRGLAATRNRGIAEAQGKYLAWLDADDEALPLRLAKQVAYMEKHPKIALLGSFASCQQENKMLHTFTPKTQTAALPVWLLFQNCFIQSTTMVRKTCLEGLHYQAAFAPAEDYALWVQLAKQFPVANLPEVLAIYHQHNQNISQQQSILQQNHTTTILHQQLIRLGIDPTATELELHKNLVHYQYQPDLLLYEKSSQWLGLLLQTQAQTKIYAQKAFETVIAEIWHKLTAMHLSCGKEAYQIYAHATPTALLPFMIKARLAVSFARKFYKLS